MEEDGTEESVCSELLVLAQLEKTNKYPITVNIKTCFILIFI